MRRRSLRHESCVTRVIDYFMFLNGRSAALSSVDEFLGTKLFSKPLSFASAGTLASVRPRLHQRHRGAGYFFGFWSDSSPTRISPCPIPVNFREHRFFAMSPIERVLLPQIMLRTTRYSSASLVPPQPASTGCRYGKRIFRPNSFLPSLVTPLLKRDR